MFRKKSFIYNWWVGTESERRWFVDIFSKEPLTSDCIIVGQINSHFYDIETSRHPVVKVTRSGVITSSGRFYPFSTAHPLYMMYLNELHSKERGVVAFNWCNDKSSENCIQADVVFPNGECKRNIIFDFIPILDEYKSFLGFSETLQCRVVLQTFDTRPFRPEYKGWVSPNEVKESAYELFEKRKGLVKDMAKLFKNLKKES